MMTNLVIIFFYKKLFYKSKELREIFLVIIKFFLVLQNKILYFAVNRDIVSMVN